MTFVLAQVRGVMDRFQGLVSVALEETFYTTMIFITKALYTMIVPFFSFSDPSTLLTCVVGECKSTSQDFTGVPFFHTVHHLITQTKVKGHDKSPGRGLGGGSPPCVLEPFMFAPEDNFGPFPCNTAKLFKLQY